MKFKTIALWVLALVCIFIAVDQMKNKFTEIPISYSKFLEKVEEGKIVSVLIQGHQVKGFLEKSSLATAGRVEGDGGASQDGEPVPERGYDDEDSGDRDLGRKSLLRKTKNIYTTIGPKLYEENLRPFLQKKKVEIRLKPPEQMSWWRVLFINWFPFILLFGTWIYILNKMQGGSGKAMSFGKSTARELEQDENRVTFKDVAGVQEAKDGLKEIVEFLKEPEKFRRLGAKIPKGVLLMGSPGTGKTLLAKAVAGEAGVPFLSISGSEFVEMFVGVGASRVRDLFEQARKKSPCIIFMDEIDAIGRQRGAGLGGGHDEREQTLNQILVEMDGFDSSTGVIMIAATNRPDVLDPALLRPGRFDRKVVVDNPDYRGRHAIMKIHTRDKPLADDVNLEILSKRTPGFTGADLHNTCNEAAILAAQLNNEIIYMKDFEEAIDRVMMGPERRSLVLSKKERTNTAYHELGHAIVGVKYPGSGKVHKVTIIPRGRSLGSTWHLPNDDQMSVSKDDFIDQIRSLLGGRLAEELALNTITTGAANDLERATNIARSMILNYGMGKSIGPLSYADGNSPVFLGRDFVEKRSYSEKVAEKIDQEIREIIDGCYEDTKKVLEDNLDNLHHMAKVLLERETINSEELKLLLDGKELPPLVLDEEKRKVNDKKGTEQKEGESDTEKSEGDKETLGGPSSGELSADDGSEEVS